MAVETWFPNTVPGNPSRLRCFWRKKELHDHLGFGGGSSGMPPGALTSGHMSTRKALRSPAARDPLEGCSGHVACDAEHGAPLCLAWWECLPTARGRRCPNKEALAGHHLRHCSSEELSCAYPFCSDSLGGQKQEWVCFFLFKEQRRNLSSWLY